MTDGESVGAALRRNKDALLDQLWRSLGARRNGREEILVWADGPADAVQEGALPFHLGWITALLGVIRAAHRVHHLPHAAQVQPHQFRIRRKVIQAHVNAGLDGVNGCVNLAEKLGECVDAEFEEGIQFRNFSQESGGGNAAG